MHMTITNGPNELKKMRKIVQSSFYFCQLMIMKDCCPSYQKHAMELNSVDGSMKLHAAFPSISNKSWVRSTSCFCQKTKIFQA